MMRQSSSGRSQSKASRRFHCPVVGRSSPIRFGILDLLLPTAGPGESFRRADALSDPLLGKHEEQGGGGGMHDRRVCRGKILVFLRLLRMVEGG